MDTLPAPTAFRTPTGLAVDPATAPVPYALRREAPEDAPAIEDLLDRAFGSDRQAKRSYAYRQGVSPVAELGFVADRPDGSVLGTLRFWPVLVGDAAHPALLLGPIAVEPGLKGRGIGKALMRKGLFEARRRGHGLVVLVGDLPYYALFGFQPAAHKGIVMPFERPHRVLCLELIEGAAGAGGTLTAAHALPVAPTRHRTPP
ncbi:GNAT family N-acetyltransferase [Roseospira navarrensis]|uniref:GNAT family N-acetyltransferase n=1 Tax=Roseospira navarrensis TaxID=140058 RepID=A0A7X1ZGS0_9PROT|nr:N-acetyltransferase [Roseospira navarrensis]MQX38082.1 GNAT family N-acetyltransferase [Roseospira navarrensis]